MSYTVLRSIEIRRKRNMIDFEDRETTETQNFEWFCNGRYTDR